MNLFGGNGAAAEAVSDTTPTETSLTLANQQSIAQHPSENPGISPQTADIASSLQDAGVSPNPGNTAPQVYPDARAPEAMTR